MTPRSAAGPVRLDVWLNAVRLAPSRAAATKDCEGGRIRVAGATAKPARKVKVGDEIEVRQPRRTRLVKVTVLIEKRVGAPVAVQCYEVLTDHIDGPARDEFPGLEWAARDRGTGRPTKRDRREIDRLRRGNSG
ncbi:MAG: RNA-binding S4 domain-containing protein [Actinobacteria bacterium]|nr:RNA-binding S4 domain-containing protein [Actinomycetota bacterium]